MNFKYNNIKFRINILIDMNNNRFENERLLMSMYGGDSLEGEEFQGGSDFYMLLQFFCSANNNDKN